MSIAFITGLAGLIGSESCKLFHDKGLQIVGIDNNMRAYFLAKTAPRVESKILESSLKNYRHCSIDIRDETSYESVPCRIRPSISVVIHRASRRMTGPRANR